jgi:hypothetical protein
VCDRICVLPAQPLDPSFRSVWSLSGCNCSTYASFAVSPAHRLSFVQRARERRPPGSVPRRLTSTSGSYLSLPRAILPRTRPASSTQSRYSCHPALCRALPGPQLLAFLQQPRRDALAASVLVPEPALRSDLHHCCLRCGSPLHVGRCECHSFGRCIHFDPSLPFSPRRCARCGSCLT